MISALRAGTSEAHRVLEAQIRIEDACREITSYRNLLRAFRGFYEPLEKNLKAVAGWDKFGFFWEERSKIGMLESDLRALEDERSDWGNPCAFVPRPSSISPAFGCAYVLEGATLGGRQILTILEKSEIPPAARNFFSSYGESVGPKWREFCGMLERLDLSETAPAVEMALQTFESLSKWLEGKI